MKVLAKFTALFVVGLVATFLVAGTLQDRVNRRPIDGSYMPTAERDIDEHGWRTDAVTKRELVPPPKTLRMPAVSSATPGGLIVAAEQKN